MAVKVQVVFDCRDPDALAGFWAVALEYERQRPPEGFDSWEAWLIATGIPQEDRNDASAIVDPDGRGPRIFFQRVPEPKTIKNRLHLDLLVDPEVKDPHERWGLIEAEADRLRGAGAGYVRDVEAYGQRWITLRDPEGNEFDVA